MKKTFQLAVFALATAFVLHSCGRKENTQTTNETVVSEETPATISNDLHIESNDQMNYSTDELKAKTGKISLMLHHTGKMEKNVMGHNLVILKPGTDIADFSTKAMNAKNTDYIPASENANIIAHTKLIGGGESDTIEFTIDEKGTYDFICSFPGHSSLMKGKLIVE